MNLSKHILWILPFFVSLILPAQPVESDAILGAWLNENEVAKIEIYKLNFKYYGKVTWGTGSDTKDVKNPNPKLRDRNLVGLIILQDFTYSGKTSWENGTIYDPREGKTYAAKLILDNNGNLKVRGFIGISLFGRTEVWSKI